MNGEKRRERMQALLPLIIIPLACGILLAAVHVLTADRIRRNENLGTLRMMSEVMPLPHDNDMAMDVLVPGDLPFPETGTPVTAYRARSDGTPVGLVLLPVPARGYNGVIELAVGIAWDGRLTGVRVIRQRETEGLGDQVDQRHSDWIFGFNDRSLEDTPPSAWAVESEGGEFDQISGATISPRGVIKAVRAALEYYEINRDRLWR